MQARQLDKKEREGARTFKITTESVTSSSCTTTADSDFLLSKK